MRHNAIAVTTPPALAAAASDQSFQESRTRMDDNEMAHIFAVNFFLNSN